MCQFPYYPATYIMRQVDSGTHRSIDIWRFKSTKSNRTYIVEIEHFGKHLIAVKFFPKDFRNSKFRYSMMTNDYEPRTIVYSCLYVVKHYIDSDPLLSFGFVAASDIDEKKQQTPVNRRFSVYRKIMNLFFGTQTFLHIQDASRRVYLLVSKKSLADSVVTIEQFEDLLNRLYTEEFNLSWD